MVFLHRRTKTASKGKTIRQLKNLRKETCATYDSELVLNFLKSIGKRNTAIEETGVVPLAIDLRNRRRKGLISSQMNENRNQIPVTYMK